MAEGTQGKFVRQLNCTLPDFIVRYLSKKVKGLQMEVVVEVSKRPRIVVAKEQAAAVCCRKLQDGEVEVLLISSLDTGRWVIPKGTIEHCEYTFRCAQREALEEAGVSGKVRKRPLGIYVYLKDRELPTTVTVHLLKVEKERSHFHEMGQRKRCWVSAEKAAELVAEDGLKRIFTAMAAKCPLNSQDDARPRRYPSFATRPSGSNA